MMRAGKTLAPNELGPNQLVGTGLVRTGLGLEVILLIIFSSCVFAGAADWEPVPPTANNIWIAYRGSALEKLPGGPDGAQALHVTVKETNGGARIEATPRGGMGNRVRLALTYRVLSGGPVAVYVGPNNWDQLAGFLSSREWETATIEVGLLSDYCLVVHLAQPAPIGAFELGEFKVVARPGDRRRVDVAIVAHSPGKPGMGLTANGSPEKPLVERVEDKDLPGPAYHITFAGKGASAGVHQMLGNLPAGTRVTLESRCRVAPGTPRTNELVRGTQARLGFLVRNKAVAEEQVTETGWTAHSVSHLFQEDGQPEWFMGQASGQAAELWAAEVHAWIVLPDPIGPGVVAVPAKRQPILFSVKDAKSIEVTPPWAEIPPIRCHLEYNSRWGFASPESYDLKMSDKKDAFDLAWHFKDDPVQYSVHMKVDQPDSALIEARITNGGPKSVEEFVPGFCVQTVGAYSPRTFVYTVIPQSGKPFPLDGGTPIAARPPLWAGIGWARAAYSGAPACITRPGLGAVYKPAPPNGIRETGDFPLLARRIPGRDAWVAWLWSNGTSYFGNTMGPCMHMDPVVAACPAGKARSVFGRLIFCEGSWDQLYERACKERPALEAMGRPLE